MRTIRTIRLQSVRIIKTGKLYPQKKEEDQFNGFFFQKFCLDEQNLLEQITSNLISKISRTREN